MFVFRPVYPGGTVTLGTGRSQGWRKKSKGAFDGFWSPLKGCYPPPPKTHMAIENPLFEEVFPIENRDFSLPCQFSGVYGKNTPSEFWVWFHPSTWNQSNKKQTSCDVSHRDVWSLGTILGGSGSCGEKLRKVSSRHPEKSSDNSSYRLEVVELLK